MRVERHLIVTNARSVGTRNATAALPFIVAATARQAACERAVWNRGYCALEKCGCSFNPRAWPTFRPALRNYILTRLDTPFAVGAPGLPSGVHGAKHRPARRGPKRPQSVLLFAEAVAQSRLGKGGPSSSYGRGPGAIRRLDRARIARQVHFSPRRTARRVDSPRGESVDQAQPTSRIRKGAGG